MSGESSSPINTRSAADIRQDIVDYVLKHTDELADVPCVKEFVDEHGRLTKEIAEVKARQERLAKAKEEYEPLEQRVGSCRLALNDSETQLAKLYAPLGDAAFKAVLADDIDEQPLFVDRLAAHKRVQLLQAECDALLPGADTGVVQKTKAKSKQLAIKAKIKLEERKFGGLQTEIGRKIVEDELDESIQCNPTNELLSQIKDQRDGIASLSAELKEAESELTESGKRLSETVGLASIGRSKDLDTAIKLGDKNIKQHDSDVATATRGLTNALSEVDASTLPNTLVLLLKGFAGRTKGFSFASAKEYWSGLRRRTQLIIVGSVVVVVVVLGMWDAVLKTQQSAKRIYSQMTMKTIASAVFEYSYQHHTWPDNLDQVKDLVNERHAPPTFQAEHWLQNPATGDDPGYEYVKPGDGSLDPSAVLLYQLRDGKRDIILAMCFGDTSVGTVWHSRGIDDVLDSNDGKEEIDFDPKEPPEASKRGEPSEPLNITDFIDNTGKYKGKTFRWKLTVSEESLLGTNKSLRDLVGRDVDMQYLAVDLQFILKIRIPAGLSVPKATYANFLIVTFICKDGDLRHGNVATSIERP